MDSRKKVGKDIKYGQKATLRFQKVSHKLRDNMQHKDPVSPVISGVDTTSLLQFFYAQTSPLTLERLLKHLKLHQKMKHPLRTLLKSLQQEGHLESLQDGRWIKSSNRQELIGVFSVQRSGTTFVILEKKDGEVQSDVFIPVNHRNGAWHGDRVSVVLMSHNRRGKNFEGQVLHILERSLKELVVSVSNDKFGELYICYSVDYRFSVTFAVDVSFISPLPQQGDLLLITPGLQIKKGMFAGVAKKVLGAEKDVYTQEEVVKNIYKIPSGFFDDILKEGILLQADFNEYIKMHSGDTVLPYEEISKVSTSVRQDLRSVGFVTIDGEDAKDFDDAICVYKKNDGWELWVAIADVGHFIKADSLIDKEARTRSNSYYFPTSVSPMLPESLSNGICSLQPEQLRMVMATKLCFDKKGILKSSIFFPGVISSQARLTYEQVHFTLESKDPLKVSGNSQLLEMLENASTLAKLLKSIRIDRGSLEFDTSESHFLIDRATGTLEGIIHQEHYFSHNLIEEFMLTANEAVAEFLTKKEIHFLYRVHQKPDHERLEKLFRVLATTHLAPQLPKTPNAGDLRNLMVQAKDIPQAFLINRMILRSMMQARYESELGEHFGLASPCYCHFTSPIRRYPDLVVHWALKKVLGDENGIEFSLQQLKSIADQCNTRERVAQDAEREIAKRLSCIFLYGREGETFEAVVTSVTDFGFFVELVNAPIEGIIRLTSLKYDWFEYNQDRQELMGVRTGKYFQLGQMVEVVLVSASLIRLEIEFTILEKNNMPSRGKTQKKGTYRKRKPISS